MKIVFTKSNNIISKLICGITGEPFSHVAIIPFDECVFHSTFTGVNFITYTRFMESKSNVCELPINGDLSHVSEIAFRYGKASYDFKALLWCGLMLTLRRWFPKWIPKQNLWQSSGMFMCTELITAILGEVDSMITPYQLYLKLTMELNNEYTNSIKPT